MGEAGSYVLVLHLVREAEISIGRLRTFSFPSGYYLYVGSARGPGGVEARLARHLRKRKQARWHIDYLLRETRVVEIWKASSRERLECLWARTLLRLPGARALPSGFGSSDCSCPSHLIHFPSPPSFHAFSSQLRASGLKPSPAREISGDSRESQ
jgi:Uri superfamily endonuclease